MKYLEHKERITGTIVISKDDESVFRHICRDEDIYYKQLAINIDESIRLEIQALTVMDILTLGEHLGIASMTRRMKQNV